MKKRGVMMALGLVMTLTTCEGGNAGATAAPSSGSKTQAETEIEKKTEADTAGRGEREESRTKASSDTVTLKLFDNQPDRNCTTITVEWFADQVRECTNGRVNIEVYNNGTPGDAISCLERLRYDGMDIVKADLSAMTNFVGEYDALVVLYVYKNTGHFWRVHGGDTDMGILRGDKMREKKLYGPIYYDGGARCLYNTKKEIHSPEDMKGMLVRIQQSELMMSVVEALGGQSVVMAYSEAYSVLQTGVVDTAENSIVNYLDQSHLEAAPYFAEDHHTRSADTLVMGEKSREELSVEDLKIIDNTALEPREYQGKPWAEAKGESKQKLLEQDIAITELTRGELKVFQDACEPI